MNMSDSNVGGRKNQSIRDNLFIVNGIVNDAVTNKHNIDLSLYDIAKCFDAQWFEETMNDLWDVGVKDDKFALISEMNSKCKIAIKTPVGQTDRFEMDRIEMQGTVMAPIKASVQLDTLGRDCYMRKEGLYIYKKCVAVPPLMMIDDLAAFSVCGTDSIKSNAIINAKIACKKLEFGPSKCFNMHIGKEIQSCTKLKVNDKSTMAVKSHETYLGEVICTSGSNDRNIQNKRNSGLSAVSQITSMLNKISLGYYYFEIALVLRDTILISKMASSSEIWYDITKQQLRQLEQIDEMFLLQVFCAPKSTPRLNLYIECGRLPLQYVIKTRRMMYYWHILHLDKSELLYKFYVAQKLKANKNDWVTQIIKDKKDLQIEISDEEVARMSKFRFKQLLKDKVNEFATKCFKAIQLKQSKSSKLEISKSIKPAEYLFSKNLCLEEKQTLFKLRSRTIDVKMNQESAYRNKTWCQTCFLFPESQEHIFNCTEIRENMKDVNINGVNYEMIYGEYEKQEKFVKIYHLMLKVRKDMLNKSSTAGGPVHQ